MSFKQTLIINYKMNTYDNNFSTLQYYQVNTKKDSKYNEQLPTSIFEICINKDDTLEITFMLTDDINDTYGYQCQGFAQFYLLNSDGRVLYSYKSKQGSDNKSITCFDLNVTKTIPLKRKIEIIKSVKKGKIVCKYWLCDCSDCYYNIKVVSLNKNNSIDNCYLKHTHLK
jgi:hypothetical protein